MNVYVHVCVSQALAMALDFARIALAPCLTSGTERSIKLMQASMTGLSPGLEPANDNLGHGFSEIAFPLQVRIHPRSLLLKRAHR